MSMNGTRIAGIVGVVVSVVFLMMMVPNIEENRFTGSGAQFYTVGPAFVPYFAGAFTLLFSVLMALSTGARQDAAAEDGITKAVLFMVILTVFCFGIEILGFLLAAVFFLGGTFICFRAGRPLLSAVIAVSAPIAIDLLLRKVFLVPLPTAPFLN